MSSSSSQTTGEPSKSPRQRRRKHSGSRRRSRNTTMTTVEPPLSPSSPFSWRLERPSTSSSPSSSQKKKGSIADSRPPPPPPPPSSPDSPFSWRLERRRSPPKKSHGIAPAKFHAKTNEDDLRQHNTTTSSSLPVWREQIERNLLIQQQKAYTGELNARRREFRRRTQLKTWPLQDMA